VIGSFHRRTGKVLGLVLAAVWVVTLAFADTAVAPAMQCQRGHMPCCPSTGDSAGCTGNNCSAARCTEQVPEKAEAQVVKAREGEAVAASPVRMGAVGLATAQPVRELTSGLRFSAPVFRLKDDLRI
jgi:hypothetical protein